MPADLDPARRPIYGLDRRVWRSEDEAAAWLDAELRRRAHPVETDRGDEELAIYLLRWWEAGLPLWPPRTAGAYKRSLALLVPRLGRLRLSELTHVRIREALSAILASTWTRTRADGTITSERPYSRRTVEHARMVLGIALGDLVPDVLASNPVRRVKLPKAQLPEQPVWDADQAERFLEAAERSAPHLALAFRLLLTRGLRHGELLVLEWKDLDEKRRVLTVDETAGARAGEVGDTKGRRRREIPLSDELVARLRAHRVEQQTILPSAWIFANPYSGLPWVTSTLDYWIPEIARQAGVPPISPKDMRATAATNLLLGGMPLVLVSQLLGHSSIAVTSAFYERVLRGRDALLARVADDLDAALERASETARGEAPRSITRVEEKDPRRGDAGGRTEKGATAGTPV